MSVLHEFYNLVMYFDFHAKVNLCYPNKWLTRAISPYLLEMFQHSFRIIFKWLKMSKIMLVDAVSIINFVLCYAKRCMYICAIYILFFPSPCCKGTNHDAISIFNEFNEWSLRRITTLCARVHSRRLFVETTLPSNIVSYVKLNFCEYNFLHR